MSNTGSSMTVPKRSYPGMALMAASFVLVASCMDHTVKQLHSKDGEATFTLPAQYTPSYANKELITFAFHYPGMEPITPGKAPEKDEIKIYLSPTMAPDRPSANYAKGLEARAVDQFNPRLPGLEYRTGRQGAYRMYQMGDPDQPDSLSKYYVFQAVDGQQVFVIDPIDFMVLFKAHRTIDYRFDVQYTIAKPVGKDFVKIDEVVTALINRHTTIRQSSRE